MLLAGSIGIAIATYNGEKYIKQQLDSIIKQSRKPDLIVISDGNSSDGTVIECGKILSKTNIPYKVLISDIQLSVRDNFQKALIACDTDFILFCDQDDVWNEKKIEYTMSGFVDQKVYMVFTNAIIVDYELNEVGKSLWDLIGYKVNKTVTRYDKGSNEFLSLLFKHNIVTGMCMAIRKELKNYSIPFTTHSLHDVWMAFLAINYGDVIAINEKCVLYRQHDNNAVGTQISLESLIKHKPLYTTRLVSRKGFIEDVVQRKKTISSTSEKTDIAYKKYYFFINERKKFLERKNSIFFPLQNIMLYKKYEYKYWQIIIKDYISRLF